MRREVMPLRRRRGRSTGRLDGGHGRERLVAGGTRRL